MCGSPLYGIKGSVYGFAGYVGWLMKMVPDGIRHGDQRNKSIKCSGDGEMLRTLYFYIACYLPFEQ